MQGRRIAAVALVAGVLFGACTDDGDDDAGTDSPLENATAPTGLGGGDQPAATGTTLADGTVAEGCAAFGEAFTALASSVAGGEIDEDALASIDDLIDDAPDDVRGDLETFVATYRDYADAADPATLIETFSSDEFIAATQGVQQFIAGDCR